MSATAPQLDAILKGLIPLNSLAPANFTKLTTQTRVEHLSAGAPLFRQGDIDSWTFYLLGGEVTLASKNQPAQTVAAGSALTKHPLGHQQPRQFTATAKTAISFVRVDSQLLDTLLTWDQVAGYEVTEFEGDASDAGWMVAVLQTQAFLKLPPEHIQSLFSRLQQIDVKAGHVVIRQGDKGDYYYIIKEGRCRVTRQAKTDAAPTTLADLDVGAAFGEEALLSDAPRNATVTMLTDGSLMRLSQGDFTRLMKAPLLNWLAPSDAVAMVRAGAGLLDVRLESEHQNGNIKGSINLPLYSLRTKIAALDRSRKYVVYCDTGRRSAAAAFLLGERGIDAYVLKGGLAALAKPNT